jgi:hypothetical protein
MRLRKGDKCDSYFQAPPDFSGKPMVRRCKNDAVEVIKTGHPGVFAEVLACLDCAPKLKAQYGGSR